METAHDELAAEIVLQAQSAEFQQWLTALLLRIMAIDTSIGPDVERLAASESAVFDVLSQTALSLGYSQKAIRRVPIRPEICKHPAYTVPYYAVGDAGSIYAGRSNLVIDALGGGSLETLVINAHVDTVAPHVPPTVDGHFVCGRGAVDDKGGCVAAMGALRLLQKLRPKWRDSCQNGLQLQFVIEEEMGGNGSLSLTLEPFPPLAAVVVLEPTDLQIHPGNRGAVWYRAELDTGQTPGMSAANMAFAAVLAMEKEGIRIRAESEHPLFPHKPVQTNHGILGPFGTHPSTVCDRVSILLRGVDITVGSDTIIGRIEEAIARYCAEYGDKVRDKMLPQHYTVERRGENAVVHFFGISGHMGAFAQCDSAILKAAYVGDALPRDVCVEVAAIDGPHTAIIVEGGQGFLPSHSLALIQQRMANAAISGIKRLAESRGAAFDENMARIGFDKLHNDAYAGSADAPWAKAAACAARSVGIRIREPLIGYSVSCDARLFAHAFPIAEVITFGPGHIGQAHRSTRRLTLPMWHWRLLPCAAGYCESQDRGIRDAGRSTPQEY